MVVLIDSENMVALMKKWEDEGNGITQSSANLAPAWEFEAVVFGGCVYLYPMMHEAQGKIEEWLEANFYRVVHTVKVMQAYYFHFA